MIWQGCVASNGPGKCAQSTFFALKDAQESGTGHSRLSLLCRVLAEDVSAPSARKLHPAHSTLAIGNAPLTVIKSERRFYDDKGGRITPHTSSGLPHSILY